MIKMDGKFYGQIRKAKDDTIVPEDEWVCFLVKDNVFAAWLPTYRDKCIEANCDSDQIEALDRMIERVKDWRLANLDRCKDPDAKGEKLLG